MPKIFVLRHQLAEQQAKLRQHDKGQNDGENSSNSPSLSSDEEKFESAASKEVVLVQPGTSGTTLVLGPVVPQPQQPEVSDILQRPPPGLVIQPIPAPQPQTSSAPSTSNSETAGKQTLMFIHSQKAPRYEEIMSKLDNIELSSTFCGLLRKPQVVPI